jgi:LAO/AO transport system kinase
MEARGWHDPPLMEQSGLAERLLAGDRRALARAITLVEDGDPAGAELVREIYPHTGRASIVGFTGPPGAGKSTLIGALTARRRRLGRQIGVLSVDPSSPFSGGAVLGDRIRLAEHFLDGGVFIRSMATRGALGGLARAALQAALLMDAAGREEVFVETVGVGQGEIDIVAHADTVVLVLVPGSGDSVQALKAGVMEIPDVIVVNKADMALSGALLRDVRSVLTLAPRSGWQVPVLATDARSGEGVEELDAALLAHRGELEASGSLAERRRRNLRAEVIALATASWREELERRLAADAGFEALIEEVVARHLDPASAARELSGGAGA